VHRVEQKRVTNNNNNSLHVVEIVGDSFPEEFAGAIARSIFACVSASQWIVLAASNDATCVTTSLNLPHGVAWLSTGGSVDHIDSQYYLFPMDAMLTGLAAALTMCATRAKTTLTVYLATFAREFGCATPDAKIARAWARPAIQATFGTISDTDFVESENNVVASLERHQTRLTRDFGSMYA
jgi:hypothetical protein